VNCINIRCITYYYHWTLNWIFFISVTVYYQLFVPKITVAFVLPSGGGNAIHHGYCLHYYYYQGHLIYWLICVLINCLDCKILIILALCCPSVQYTIIFVCCMYHTCERPRVSSQAPLAHSSPLPPRSSIRPSSTIRADSALIFSLKIIVQPTDIQLQSLEYYTSFLLVSTWDLGEVTNKRGEFSSTTSQ